MERFHDRAAPCDESYHEDIQMALGYRRDREISTATFERQLNRDGISALDGSPTVTISTPLEPCHCPVDLYKLMVLRELPD
jgi:hypothetical protein